jgi:hypothetical protein
MDFERKQEARKRTVTGPSKLPDDLVAGVDAFARQFVQPEMRDGDTFAAETVAPPEVTTLERIVAFSGREVHS